MALPLRRSDATPSPGHRYETVHGQVLVAPWPGPSHQRVVRRLMYALARYLRAYPATALEVFGAPAAVTPGPDSLIEPDLFVIPREETRADRWERVQSLFLVAEVLSPATARQDRVVKRRLYREMMVPLYWVLDPTTRSVEVWTPYAETPHVECDVLEWHPVGAPEPVLVSLPDVFAA